MRRRLMTAWGTDVYLHAGTLLYLAYALLTGTLPTVMTAMLSVLLHECAHAAASAMLGQKPREVELTPLGAVMRLDDEEGLPAGKRLLMVLAGPAASMGLCVLAYALTAGGILPSGAGRRLFLSNAAILTVNLLPALPLDGGRIVMLALTALLPAAAARRAIRIAGTVTGGGLIILGAWLSWRSGAVQLSLACAGCFILYSTSSALTTQAMAELRRLMDRKILLERRGHLPCRCIAILKSTPLHRCMKLLPPGNMAVFAVIEGGTQNVCGLMTEQQLVQAWLDDPSGDCRSALEGQSGNKLSTIFQGMTKREQATH